jgi:hypothetical protein
MPTPLQFKDLKRGDTFDFIDDNGAYNSFFDRCEKTGPRTYWSKRTGQSYKVGSIKAKVFHVTIKDY